MAARPRCGTGRLGPLSALSCWYRTSRARQSVAGSNRPEASSRWGRNCNGRRAPDRGCDSGPRPWESPCGRQHRSGCRYPASRSCRGAPAIRLSRPSCVWGPHGHDGGPTRWVQLAAACGAHRRPSGRRPRPLRSGPGRRPLGLPRRTLHPSPDQHHPVPSVTPQRHVLLLQHRDPEPVRRPGGPHRPLEPRRTHPRRHRGRRPSRRAAGKEPSPDRTSPPMPPAWRLRGGAVR